MTATVHPGDALPDRGGRDSSRGPVGRRRRRGSTLAIASFLAIFPGFFVYHGLTAAGLLPPTLRGYSTAIALLVLPLLVPAYLRQPPGDAGVRLFDAAYLLFIVYFTGVLAVQALGGANPGVVASQFAIVPQFVALYLCFRLIDTTGTGFRAAAWAALLLMSTIIFSNVTEGTFVIAALDIKVDDETAANYQAFAFIYLVCTLACLVGLTRAWSRGLLYLVAVAALFLNGARSEFIGLFIAALIIELSLVRRRWLALGATLALLLAVVVAADRFADELPRNRVVDLIESSAASSLGERGEYLDHALRTLQEHPFLGDFASYPPGAYAHNALSAWVDLGLIGFVLFCLLLLLPLADLLGQFGRRCREPRYLLVLVSLVVTIVMFVFSKFFTHQMFPVALGLYAGDAALRRRDDSQRSRR